MMSDIPAPQLRSFSRALPFWLPLGLIPLAWVTALYGGWSLVILPFATWYLFSFLDFLTGLEKRNADPQTPDADLKWYRAITLIWAPIQIITIYAILWYTVTTDHLVGWEEWVLFGGLGVISGTIGINYSHELMHQKPRIERWLADILLAFVLYSHFRSEHLLVHHRYVGTPKDPVSARFNEHFWKFLPRVLRSSWVSAFNAEKAMLARKNIPWTAPSNPFFRYWALQAVFLVIAGLIGGWWGVALFAYQASVAILQLELVNYIEHYGLTRKHLGDGKYEHVLPRHSWNAEQKASNWLLINLQRHSDHHYKPDRRFPLLQTYSKDDAPQLPYGYSVMTMAALFPRLWRKVMNPRVMAWREKYYPEITDWQPYKDATNPLPR
jgi:alkane 1-monooxygenase